MLSATTKNRPAALLTPPDLARRWGVSPDKIRAWIESGELRAINLAARLGGRPRWRIDPAAVAEFEERRRATSTPRTPRRRRKDTEVIDFF